MKQTIAAIAAIGKNRELGLDDKLLWSIPDDLKRFRDLTRGHPIIMGRKTFESIIGYRGKPLPERTNIVVSHDVNYAKSLLERGLSGVLLAGSVEEAIALAKVQPGHEEILICGGAQIYKAALPYTDKLYLTLIDDSKHADTLFPEYEKDFPRKTFEESREWNGLTYTWANLER